MEDAKEKNTTKQDQETVEESKPDAVDVQQLDEEPTKKERKSKQKQQIEALEDELATIKDKLLRNAAELENFKKRINQERINDRKYASKYLIGELLNPLEQMNKIVNMPTDNDMLKNFLIGFKMVNDQFYAVLKQDGLKEIEALNQPFDPKLHHAIEKTSDKEHADGIILEVIQKGFIYKDQLLRPAMVKVNEWSEENGKDK